MENETGVCFVSAKNAFDGDEQIIAPFSEVYVG